MQRQPTGVVTLLFTDVEGSTRLLDRLGPQVFAEVLERHRELLRAAFEAHDGYEVDTEGDAFFVAFASADAAAAAAASAQAALAAEDWPRGVEVRVRMGLHTGEPLAAAGRYIGLDVHQAARIMAAGHGGQVLLSAATRRGLGPEWDTVALGEHRLKDLLQAVPLFQLTVPGLPGAFPPLRTLGNRPTNLPVQRDPLIGRGTQIGEVAAMLRDRDAGRLVTLTGPGGTGKTRLALHVAAELLDDCPSGVFVVPLASVTDPAAVLATVADALALRAVAGETPAELLAGHLADRTMLLVLDNLEQVVAAGPDVAQLLDHCPGLSVLATSRVRLNVRGERVHPVPPLSLPTASADGEAAARSEAVALFATRAAAAGADVPLTAENAAAIGDICRRLDGLPLAIELAAAWAPVLPLPALLARLGRALRLLTRGRADADHRQRTLRGTVHWSYDLLDEAEQVLFARSAVFVDGCRLDAAEAVCADPEPGGRLAVDDVLPGLASLVEKNLLQRRTDPDGEPRFRMLQTIREFAGDVLAADPAEVAAVRARHADHYLGLPGSLADEGLGVGEELRRLHADRANLQAAFETAHEQGRIDRIAAAIPYLWRMWKGTPVGMQDGLRWAELVVARRDELDDGVRLGVLIAVSELFRFAGDLARSRALKEESIALARGAPELLQAPTMRRRFAYTLAALADIAMDEGRHDDARALARESLEEGAGYRALVSLGYLALLEDDLATAERYMLEALPGARSTDDYNYNETLSILGAVRLRMGDPEGAESYLVASLRGFLGIGDTLSVALSIDGLAAAAAVRGDLDRAGRLYGAAQAHGSFVYEQSEVGPEVAARLPADAVRAGRALSVEDAVAYALAGVVG